MRFMLKSVGKPPSSGSSTTAEVTNHESRINESRITNMWQELSRIAIVGTDKMPLSDQLKAKIAALGVKFDATTPDTILLQKALIMVGLLDKSAHLVKKGTEQPSVWQPHETEKEAPEAGPWLRALCTDKSDFIFDVLAQLRERSFLFPAVYLPVLIENHAKSPNLYALLDSRALYFIAQIPEYQQYKKRFEQKALKQKPKPEAAPPDKVQFLAQVRTAAPFDMSALSQLATQLTESEQTDVYKFFFDRGRTQPEVKAFLLIVAVQYEQTVISEILELMHSKQMQHFYQDAIQNCLQLLQLRDSLQMIWQFPRGMKHQIRQ